MAGSKSTRAGGHAFEPGHQFKGLSAKQLEMILEQVVVSACVIAEFARDAAQRADESVQNDFHVIQHMTERLGALAEIPLDAVAHGPASFEGWVLGPQYAEIDKAPNVAAEGA